MHQESTKQECAMSKTIRNNVARGMIVSGQGKKQVFKDRRNKRPKDAKRSWQRDQDGNG